MTTKIFDKYISFRLALMVASFDEIWMREHRQWMKLLSNITLGEYTGIVERVSKDTLYEKTIRS